MGYNSLDNSKKLEVSNHNLVYDELQIFQKKILDIFIGCDFNFSFTGGTALSLKYLDNHRKSYDLDFFGKFSEEKEDVFESFEKKLLSESIQIISKNEVNEHDLKLLKYIVSCNINENDVLMKVEFVEDYFYSILFSKSIGKIDPIESIYFRKIFTLTTFNKERIKDLIDLFHLNKYKNLTLFFNEDFLICYNQLFDESLKFDSSHICRTLNSWLRHISYNEHIIEEELAKYGSLIKVEQLNELFNEFCRNLCYKK